MFAQSRSLCLGLVDKLKLLLMINWLCQHCEMGNLQAFNKAGLLVVLI